MDDDEKYMDECCATCKSFSSASSLYKAQKGFCLKLKRAVKRDSICGYHRPDIKVEYQMECKPPEKTSAPPKNHFCN